ncbi:type I-E CRISPR-associated protein Cse2/CasB [Rhodococcus qingshengii]|uniref:type I-E CRISPR-associated protein Cse2/CasB n=1 Tax=Rhodococcus qingshengii TaxID=334542 RepID=UPI0035D65840
MCNDPGARADLRTGNRPGVLDTPWRMMPHLAKYLPRFTEQQRIYLTVAAWYADQSPNPRTVRSAALPSAWTPGQGNIGWSLATASSRGLINGKVTLKRLEMVTRMQTNREAMRTNLAPLVRTLCEKNVPIFWAVLLKDLDQWRWEPTWVTKRWLDAYYDPKYHTIGK